MPGKQRPHSRISSKGKAYRAGQRHSLPSSHVGRIAPTDRIAISARTKKLMREGRLPPPPKYTVVSRPQLTRLKGRVKPVKLSQVTLPRGYPAHVAKVQSVYMKRMRSAAQSGKLPPIEVMKFGQKKFLWEGRHRFATVKGAGFTHAWSAEMKYTGKRVPFASVRKVFLDTHRKTLARQESK